MSFFVTPTPAPKIKSKDVARMSLFYAGLLVIMAVTQLFTFDSFIELFVEFDFPGEEVTAFLLPTLIVVFEVLALPFLLRMKLSPAFRWLSLACGIFVSVFWTAISLWVVTQGIVVETIGFLGTVIDTMPGWWAVLISIAFGILAVWSAWGMWPVHPKRSLSKHR